MTLPSFLGIRRLRLASGLILFAYVLTHLGNHALGNISLDAMEDGLERVLGVWRYPFGTALLFGALLLHLALGLWALYERRHFRWSAVEYLQLASGLLIPLMLAQHAIDTRIAFILLGIGKSYAQELYVFRVSAPERGVVQLCLLAVAWSHGCIGLARWLRLKPWFGRTRYLLLSGAVLVPALAMLGYYQGGRAVEQLAQDPAWRSIALAPRYTGTPAQVAQLHGIRDRVLALYGLLVAGTIAARGARVLAERRRHELSIGYPNGRTVRVPRGFSVLEASRAAGIPHASVCGGRGRCSTCRVRVIAHDGVLPPPGAAELAVLARVAAPEGIRLACQLRPAADLSIVPLVPPRTVRGTGPSHAGEERFVAVLFVDMRGSTRLAEERLPFDTVFIVNQFLDAVGHAVADAGGQPNQFLGDGMLVLFGLESDPRSACRSAIRAVHAIARNIEALNLRLAHDLPEPIAFGIGVHGGEAILGEIGYQERTVFTALGDPINVAARLQDMTKSLNCQVVLSEHLVGIAALEELAGLPAQEVQLRGRTAPVAVRLMTQA